MSDDIDEWAVVLNDQDQFSVWRAATPPPAGWRLEGTTGTRADCLAHIDRVWTDMRPRSVRLAGRSD
jgi:MbtH protein